MTGFPPRDPELPPINKEALTETLTHIFELADKAAAEAGRLLDTNLDDLEVPGWNQRAWRSTNTTCGTAFCVAGWRAQQDGLTWADDYSVLLRPGWKQLIRQYAAERFDLTPFEAGVLFESSNKLSDLHTLYEALMDDRDIAGYTFPSAWSTPVTTL